MNKNFTTLEVGSWYRAANGSLIQIKERGEDTTGVRFVDMAGVVYSEDGTFLYESLMGNNSSLVEKVLLDIQVAPKKVKKKVSISFVVNDVSLKGMVAGEWSGIKNIRCVPAKHVEEGLTTVTLSGEVEISEVEPSDIPF